MELKSISIAGKVYSEIERKIYSGEYATGLLLTETRLSNEYGVSRTPIREAIRWLEAENLIEVTGKGVYILGISRDDIEDIYEIRMRIEGIAARRAAEYIAKDALALLYETLQMQSFYTSINATDKARNADSDFHEIIYSSCKSETFTQILSTLHRRTQMYRKLSLECENRASKAVEEHKAIYSALSKGDKDEAERLTVLHVRNAKENLTKLLF